MSGAEPKLVALLSHARPEDTAGAVRELAAVAARNGARLVLDVEEWHKHAFAADLEGVRIVETLPDDIALCVALGGDGTILRALHTYLGTGVAVFSVNFGEVGFLATVEPERLAEGFELALAGKLDALKLPAIAIEAGAQGWMAFNDLALHRKIGARVAEISYTLAGDEVGRVRCDGIVIATPAGSTGYNLANGGPVLAWGVEGLAVSFISPHSLSARAIVIAPNDVLTLQNNSNEPLDVSIDGRPVGEIAAEGRIEARFVGDVAVLTQMSGSSFYRRLHEKFGRLAR
jgi:NAD+ kinase